MTSKIRSLTFDCANPARQAEFWAAVLGYEVKDVDEEGALVVDPSGQQSRLLFLIVPEGKTVKNRLHFDLTPETTREAEVQRLLGLGATVYQVFDWTVMQDPEGNEFCVEQGPGDRKAT
jgi:catechol 2,3-dioxygenase-like lactoylglutathione lyase family enzyme